MWVIGDVHGAFKTYLWILHKMMQPEEREDRGIPPAEDMPAMMQAEVDAWHNGKGLDSSVQVGDMGIFDKRDMDKIPENPNHKFFRGNHDNPALCRSHPNYLSDYGYDSKDGIFWMAGGYSIDWTWRTIGIDFWDDEELAYGQLMQVINMYADVKPKIMLSHECPTAIKAEALSNPGKRNIQSRTEIALHEMWKIHQPELWVFGHHHRRVEQKIDKTHFVGLGEIKYGHLKDGIYEIPGVKLPGI